MQIAPRYGDPPVMRIESFMDDPATPLLRQRTRLATRLASLDDAQWAAPSRCQDWSVQDVVAHLVTTNQFWALSVTSARDGAPTRFLDGFDPVVVPAQLVDDARSWSPAQTLERFTRSNQDLADAVADLDDDGWDRLAEAPPGHLSIRLVALHALWDAWIHERDIVLPLGLAPVDEPDEIAGSLAYVAAPGSRLPGPERLHPSRHHRRADHRTRTCACWWRSVPRWCCTTGRPTRPQHPTRPR